MQNMTVLLSLLVFALLAMGTGCSQGGGQTSASDTVNAPYSLPQNGNFRLSLTDAPHPSLSHVVVNVDHVELLLEKGGQQARYIVAQNLGPVDLLKLRDGVHLPLKDMNFQSAVIVKQFRMVLKSEGNYIQRIDDDSLCDLKTPSEQQTGLKLIMPNGGVQVDDNGMYSLIVDFDVDHSIVDNRSNCLLKPVLKMKRLDKVCDDSHSDSEKPHSGSFDDDDDNDHSGVSEEQPTCTPYSSGDDSSSSGDVTSGSGSDSGSTGDTSGTTTSGDTSSGGTATSGDTSSTGTDPGTGTSTGTDTGSGTGTTSGTGDGAPIVSDANAYYFKI